MTAPYMTTNAYASKPPTWVQSADDQVRVAAYQLFEGIYENTTDMFNLVQRGANEQPVQMLTGRGIIETINRFLCVGMTYAIDPTIGTPADQATASLLLGALWDREEMAAKLATQKRYGLIRGDAIWHVTADPLKPAGTRLSVSEVDPSNYFPIEDPANPGRVVGCHLVTQELQPDGTTYLARRRTYRKDPATGKITSELSYFESAAWDDRTPALAANLKPATSATGTAEPSVELPAQITAIPVYLVKNRRLPGFLFGLSEFSGAESQMRALNQSLSDEDITLAMQGIGFYYTNSGPPVNADGEETTWRIGPGMVAELDPDSEMGRVGGVSTVAPFIDHMTFILKQLHEDLGLPDIARGVVDSTVAESGIALALKMAPLLSANDERATEITSSLNHMLYDIINGFFPAYEATTLVVKVTMTYESNPVPANLQQDITNWTALKTAGVVDAQWIRDQLQQVYGFVFPTDIATRVSTEQAQSVDAFGARAAGELAGAPAPGTEDPSSTPA